MAELADNLNGYFVGIVYDQDVVTRELEVLIPKLMPAVPIGRDDVKISTNLGNPSINIKHSDSIIVGSTISVKAELFDAPLPEKGSKVLIYFLDGDINRGFWKKFNPVNDYEVIDDEKYADIFTLKIGDKQLKVSEKDIITIELPEDMDIVSIIEGKEKRIIVKKSDSAEIEDRVKFLETLVGNETLTINGNTTDSSGLCRDIEEILEEIKNIKSEITQIKDGD